MHACNRDVRKSIGTNGADSLATILMDVRALPARCSVMRRPTSNVAAMLQMAKTNPKMMKTYSHGVPAVRICPHSKSANGTAPIHSTRPKKTGCARKNVHAWERNENTVGERLGMRAHDTATPQRRFTNL